MYVLQSNLTLKINSQIYETDITKATELIHLSDKNLSIDDRTKLLRIGKAYDHIFSNASVKQYYEQLCSKLRNDNIRFDLTLSELHFNNGYIDLKKNEFKQRDISKHFITKCIARDYKVSEQASRDKFINSIKKYIQIRKI